MACLRTLFISGAVAAISIAAAARHSSAEDLNDYPTAARADYVFGCMKVNGETQELLQKCSCSIDVIASIIRPLRHRRDDSLDVPGHKAANSVLAFCCFSSFVPVK